MKRFNDLTNKEKKVAGKMFMKRAFKRLYDNGYVNAPQEIKDDLKKFIDKYKDEGFCGCSACLSSIMKYVNKSDRLKEFLIVKATELSKEAIYIEPGDEFIELENE